MRPPAPLGQLRDLELLLTAHHPLIFLETIEEERADVLLEHVADHLDLLYLNWSPGGGLQHGLLEGPLDDTETPSGCLEHITGSANESLYHLRDFAGLLEDASLRASLKRAHEALWNHRGAIVFTGSSAHELPSDIARLVTTVVLNPPTELEYHRFLADMLSELRTRRSIAMKLTSQDVARLIQQLKGLSFFEVRKVMTQAIAQNWAFDESVIEQALEAKKDVLMRTGVLEYSPAEQNLDDIAGLGALKRWLARRAPVFADPVKAKEFGLSAPRGILLLGIPGCGKSLCAKAVAQQYRLPLIKLDPSRLYTKYIGETEKNLRKATQTAEAMAPIVLWIDEIEKGLGHSSSGADSGVSQRVFGSFLSWLQDKPDGVFVVATCNNIDGLPPELLRKGRFDEIFFVDLPDRDTRKEIFAVHLRKRGRDPEQFDLDALAGASDGFSGSELEQAVVSALYAAYGESISLETSHIADELSTTHPLSATSAEQLERLRQWVRGRAVPAA